MYSSFVSCAFTYSHEYDRDLDIIEPIQSRHLELSLIIENACTHAVFGGAQGRCFTRVRYRTGLLTYFEATGTSIYLLSLKYDVIELLAVA